MFSKSLRYSCVYMKVKCFVYYFVDQQEDGSKRVKTETDSYNLLLLIKHSIVEKCFGISAHPNLRCLDEEQAHYKPFNHYQYLQV